MTRGQKILLALLVISIFLNYIDRSNLSLAAPVMQNEYGLSTRDIGTLSSAFFWTYALLQLFGIAGWLADRYSPGLVLAGGLFVWSVATVLTGVLSGIPMLFAARLLVGAGESVAYPCYSRIFASAIPSGRRGIANAMLDAASKLGPALGTLAGGALLASVGWRMFFIALGCLSLLWLLPWLQFLKVAPSGAVAESKTGPTTVEIVAKRSAWGAFLGHFCGNYFWFFLLTWLPTYLVNERGLAMSRMVNVTTLAYLAMAGSTICAGWISDRWIASGATPTRVRKTVVCAGLACATVILPVAVVRDGTTAVVLLIIACMSFGAYTSNHWAITQTLAGPLAAGRWTSLQNGVGNLSGIVAAWLTGRVVEQTHSFVLPFAIAAAIAVAGALFWGLVVEGVRPVEWGK
jgi:ACS family D-galactonate transporter-like MFS transporter